MSEQTAPQQDNILLEVKDLKKYFPIRKGFFKTLAGYVKAVDGVNFYIHEGETMGLVGESGCGKTTLARMIVGEQRPDAGALRLGDTVQLAYVDQSRTLDPEKTVYEVPAPARGILRRLVEPDSADRRP